MHTDLTFDIVIATRNRAEALSLSIPLMLSQSRQPQQLIVIDSSEDHVSVKKAVTQATAGWTGRVVVEHSTPSISLQRNTGIRHVTADVVFLPDDDSLFHPNTSETIMHVYERDTAEEISAVSTRDAVTPPPGILGQSTYAMSEAHKQQDKGTRRLGRLGTRLNILNPRFYLGAMVMKRTPDIPWFEEEDVVPVEWMTGFRMSFRTKVVKQFLFDETFAGYSLFEDVDASWAAWQIGCVVGARNAHIYHHRYPGGRPDGYAMGMMHVLNMTYIMAKHGHDLGCTPAQRAKIRRLVKQYVTLRMLQRGLRGLRQAAPRQEVAGMRAAFGAIEQICNTPREQLRKTYSDIRSRLQQERVSETT